jgi:hypothetical protein
VLAPNGLLLVAFHIGEETVHRDELWGHPVSLDFRFLMPERVVTSLGEAGDRAPQPTLLPPRPSCVTTYPRVDESGFRAKSAAFPRRRVRDSVSLTFTRGSGAPGPRRGAPRIPRGGSVPGRAG